MQPKYDSAVVFDTVRAPVSQSGAGALPHGSRQKGTATPAGFQRSRPNCFLRSRCGEIRACSARFPRGFSASKAGRFSCALYRVISPALGENFLCGSGSIGNPGPLRSLEGTKVPPRGWGGTPRAGPFLCVYSSPGRHIFQRGSRIFSTLFLSYTILTSPKQASGQPVKSHKNAGRYRLLTTLSAPS